MDFALTEHQQMFRDSVATFAAFIKAEQVKYAKVVREAGIRID